MKLPRLLLIDDHRIVAEGLKGILSAEFELAGVFADGKAVLEAARTMAPDVIVADISMPELNGIEALEMLRKEGLTVPVVFLTMHRELGYARRALAAGASGYVLKHAAPEELVQAVRAALDGGTFVSPMLAGALFDTMQEGASPSVDLVAQLTARQRDILRLLADGHSAKEIARTLNISSRTVEFHKYKMMELLNVKSSARLIHLAIARGLTES
jgi:DNA-binding NarL/FixJ family response regulator